MVDCRGVCSTLFTGHILQFEFAVTITEDNTCGLLRTPPTPHSTFYYNHWSTLQVTTDFVPNCMMFICVIYFYSRVRLQRTLVVVTVRREEIQQ
jgi:hypothetical protein